jgi:hypothetical protein
MKLADLARGQAYAAIVGVSHCRRDWW